MYQTVKCYNQTASLAIGYHGGFDDKNTIDLVCDSSCGLSLSYIHNSIEAACKDTLDLIPGIPLITTIDNIWSGWNDTCLIDLSIGDYCNSMFRVQF